MVKEELRAIKTMAIPSLVFEAGGGVWWLPKIVTNKMVDESFKTKKWQYRVVYNWFRVGWLLFAVGVVTFSHYEKLRWMR